MSIYRPIEGNRGKQCVAYLKFKRQNDAKHIGLLLKRASKRVLMTYEYMRYSYSSKQLHFTLSSIDRLYGGLSLLTVVSCL